ncbi:hypothetical protein DYB37_006147 [Aphanomyces astaci]|uniref:RNase NYN domain-containing protein n=1 Tax=Aphanomyces astaci TaxID=112090 RepID=A0A3R7E7Q9_APHAT|nr:hypothetical protein DYB35_003166 [Aphanomyces astaci]RHZ13097.1 hypothetical protein DYB37_006147 [Aphanomyces astaci]
MTTSQSLVVLDAANVATVVRGAVRIQRLQHAIDHFESLGIRCIAFAPGYWVKSKTLTPRSRSQQSAEMELDQKAEMAAVQELVLLEKVVLTPPQAHDDLFIIDYAMKHDGFVVTNDMFRDHVANKQHCVDHLSFEEEVRASLTPGVVEPKQPRRAKTPSKSRASTPRSNSTSNNMYRSLDEASTSSDDDKVSDQGKTHAASPDEEPHEPARPKNVQEGWNLLQSIIARSNPPSSIPTAASNNNQEEPQGNCPIKEDHPKQLEVETKALSPSQKKRGRRRAKKQAAAAMVYRGKLWAMIAIPLVGGLVLKSLVSANPHP